MKQLQQVYTEQVQSINQSIVLFKNTKATQYDINHITKIAKILLHRARRKRILVHFGVKWTH